MVQVAKATNTFGPPSGPVVVVIVADALPFWKASTTRGDVFANIWANPGAYRQPKNWATWWVFDGGDNSKHLLRMDTKGQLSAQVRDVENGPGLVVNGVRETYVCTISGDGKAMLAGNPSPGRRCWSCMLHFDDFCNHLCTVDEVDQVARPGACLRCIVLRNRVGDLYHGGGRITNSVFKRTKESAVAFGVHASCVRDLNALFADLKGAASRIPVADRVARPPTKEGTLDLSSTVLFLKDPQYSARSVEAVRVADPMTVRYMGRDILVSVAMRLLLRALLSMASTWYSVGSATLNDVVIYREACTQFGALWQAFGWKPTVWVHWIGRHSSWYLLKWRSLLLFNSIPTEYRNGPFKMNMRHCFMGWSLVSLTSRGGDSRWQFCWMGWTGGWIIGRLCTPTPRLQGKGGAPSRHEGSFFFLGYLWCKLYLV